MRRSLLAALAAAGLVLPQPAAAGTELVLGLGRDDIRNLQSPSTGGMLDLRLPAITTLGQVALGLGAGLEADADGDLWGGAGLVARIPLGDGRVRLVPSVMLGAYRQGTGGNDLGHAFPVFRVNLELDVAVAPGWRAGIALGHKSNAYTGPINPGVESLYLTINRAF